ncbi:MAG: 30S ribosomal protein S8 [Candidatus Berkelbacteria bacterium]|nr:30S ribosomal protein S8 [Candidatus Berkelbacteria bacterium]
MDPVSNMISAIKTALQVKKETIEIPISKFKVEISKILKQEGFIENYSKVDARKMVIKLKYRGKESVVTDFKRISKPGCRIYVKSKDIPVVLRGLGTVIMSTPAGIMTGKDAKKKGLGGEVIGKIW